MLRCTRLADLVKTVDSKLVAAVFGVNPSGVMIYLADHVNTGRLAAGAHARRCGTGEARAGTVPLNDTARHPWPGEERARMRTRR